MEEKTSFDYLVAGGGTAGCVIASRLSQAGFSVAVFEAGPENYSEQVMSPLAAPTLLGSPLEYNYLSKEQPQYVPSQTSLRFIFTDAPFSSALLTVVCLMLVAAYCQAPPGLIMQIGQNAMPPTTMFGVSANNLLADLDTEVRSCRRSLLRQACH